MNKKVNSGGGATQPPPARQTLVNQRLWPEEALDEDTVDDVDTQEEDTEHYATLSDQNHYSTLRKTPSGSRYQRNARTAQMSHFSQFSRLPPVPERPSLESRELSPVPDIVSPTNPILTSHHNQNNSVRPGQLSYIRFEMCSFYLKYFLEASLSSGRRSTVSPPGEMTEVHGTNTLGRKKSRIPTAKQNNRVNRSVSDPDLGTDSVDERLETLLHLLGGARQGGGRR